MRDAFEMRVRLPSTLVVVGITTALMIVIGFGLILLAPVNPNVPGLDTASQFIPSYVVALHPKPRDRFMFMSMTIALAVVIAGTALTVRKLGLKADGSMSIFSFAVFTVCVVTIVEGSFFGLQQQIDTSVILCLLFSLLWTILSLAASKIIYHISFIFIIFINIVITLFFRYMDVSNISDLAQFTSHYEAVIYSIIAIESGGTCLADVLPQYGCYGEFLAPVLKAIGYSTSHLTLIFLFLQIVASTAVFAFVRPLIGSAPLFLACTLCIVISTNLNILLGSPDPYFAYNPIRFLFPALSLPLLQWAQGKWSSPRALMLGLFAGCSLAWNLDSGIAVLGALVFFCNVRSFAQWTKIVGSFWTETVRTSSFFILGVAISCSIFLLYIVLKSSFAINISSYFMYQRLFYIAGFAMMPIPPFPSWWTIPTVIVGLVLLIISVRIGNPLAEDERVTERVGYLAALMVGLGIYFTGRSHWLVLRFAVWPAIILFFFLADQALQRSKSRASRWAGAWVTSVLLGLPLCLVIEHQSDIVICL